MQLSTRTSGVLLSFFGAIFFSTKAVMVKLAFAASHMDALSLLTVRMVFALPFYLVAAFWITNQQNNVRLTRKQWIYTLLLGAFGYYLSSLFDFMGLQYISAGLERLILFLYPTFALMINAFVFKQKLTTRQIVALVLTYCGILLAYFGELNLDSSNPNFYLGSGLVLLCAITYAIYISGSGRIIPHVGAGKFTAYAMLAATGGIFAHFLVRGDFSAFSGGSMLWGYGFALGLIATVLPSFMVSAGMKKIGASNAAIISSVGPVSTILQAHYFLGEHIFWEQIAGTALVLVGVLLLSLKKEQ